MRKLSALALIAAILFACGKDKSTNNNPGGITVTISPGRTVLDLNSTFDFSANVYGSNNQNVSWLVQDIAGGDSLYGTIDTSGLYRAPGSEPNVDSVKVTARSLADLSKSDDAWVVLVDPTMIYVAMTGSDNTGTGSLRKPYRTITKALTRATSGQIISVGVGEYNGASGETFPLVLPSGVTLRGAGSDSTYITGPVGTNPFTDAAVVFNGEVITAERLHIRSTSFSGVGIWFRPGRNNKILRSQISGEYIGIFVDGPAIPRPVLDGNIITGDSIGIVVADSAEPIIRNSIIRRCPKYGIDIRDLSRPNLGDNDSTFAGHNTIDSCGNNLYQWLIYNDSPDTIMAKGNIWQVTIPNDNDQYIRDDEESGGVAGPVLLE